MMRQAGPLRGAGLPSLSCLISASTGTAAGLRRFSSALLTKALEMPWSKSTKTMR